MARLMARFAGVKTWTVALPDERHLHLDTVMGVLGSGAYLVYAGALPGWVPADGPPAEADEIEAGDEDARRFACNLVVVGKIVITGRISAPHPPNRAPRIHGRATRAERISQSGRRY